MMEPDDKTVLRTRDVWGAIVLIGTAAFFLWRTRTIPFLGENRAGVSGADWYNSAAIVPLGIWTAILLLGIVLLVTALRQGGGAGALSAAGIGWNPSEALRIATIAAIMACYVFALVPRVDFIIASGLAITAMIWGFHDGRPGRMAIAAIAVAVPALYALVEHLPQAEWNAPHDDDLVALAAWSALTIVALAAGRGRVIRAVPFIAILVPTLLVCAIAFGFRQNVPNRGGLLFAQIEYQYYVTLRPLWRD